MTQEILICDTTYSYVTFERTVQPQTGETIWLSFSWPNAAALARWEARNVKPETFVLRYTDFYARLPEGFEGRIV